MSQILVLLALLPWLLGVGLGEEPCNSAASVPFGNWEIAAHYEPGIHAMGVEEADALLGKSVSYTESGAQFGGRRCDEPEYSTVTVSADKFFQSFLVDPEALGLKATCIDVTFVKCPKDLDFLNGALVYQEGVVLVGVKGVFFLLKRQIEPDGGIREGKSIDEDPLLYHYSDDD